MKWLYLFTAIVGEVVATLSLKASDGFSKLIPSIITIIGYGITFYFLSLALKELPMSIVYAIWAGFGIVLVSFIGVFIFKQNLDIPGIIGISLILVGAVIINLFSKMSVH